ncbi:40S ribosomal protein S5 [Selaginella moellendorffii]|nr:40S ribosomal protein S5 [Selaginella moellendorffii]|eukprot:XP_002982261.2 40S ribosomal protein S5 [Selaginella moellendorffii]
MAQAMELPAMPAEAKLFGKWSYGDLAEIEDMSLEDYIAVNGHKVGSFVPCTAGRYSRKRFKKGRCPIVERLVNALMFHGRNSGKKVMAVRIVKYAMEIIHLLTDENPIKVVLDAIQHCAPREESVSLVTRGVARRSSVDTSPLRRVNQALAFIATGTRESAFKTAKPIAECLADELINAAKGSSNSYAVRRKDEIERVAKTMR